MENVCLLSDSCMGTTAFRACIRLLLNNIAALQTNSACVACWSVAKLTKLFSVAHDKIRRVCCALMVAGVLS